MLVMQLGPLSFPVGPALALKRRQKNVVVLEGAVCVVNAWLWIKWDVSRLEKF